MTNTPVRASWDPAEPGYFVDPYPQFRAIIETNPISYVEGLGLILSRYQDVRYMMFDQSLSVDDRNLAENPRRQMIDTNAGGTDLMVQNILARIDPPDHTRLRSLIVKAFTARSLDRLRPYVEGVTEELLQQCSEEETFDVMSALAYPIPFQVICELLGIPASDRQNLREPMENMGKVMDLRLTPELVRTAARATEEVFEYFDEILEYRRRSPADDLLSLMIAAEQDGQKMSNEECKRMAALLYLAGHETTLNLIGNGMHALAENPGQFEVIRSGAAAPANAVEELLRFDSPVQFHSRVTRDEWTYEGTTVGPNTMVFGLVGAANRDPEFWGSTADTLDLQRPDARRHTSFGFGIHSCIGAALTRLEGQVFFPALCQRFSSLDLAGDDAVEHDDNLFFRGLRRLEVAAE